MPASLPLFLRLAGRAVLVAGAGRIGTRRILRLVAAGARVTVIAPKASARVAVLARRGHLTWHRRPATRADVGGQFLVFAATDAPATNAELAAAARAAGIPVQRADHAPDSDFLLPAIVERGALTIALASDGAAPTLTRLLRGRLEAWIPRAYGDLAALAGAFRERVKQRLPASQRPGFWARVLDGPIAEQVFAGRMEQARADLEAAVASAHQGLAKPVGEVFLVGGGPGDPDLLTFRALRLMQRADVVLYDSLVAPAIVELVPPHAERIHVGKRAARHTLAQSGINTLMVELAHQGKRVLRLKGGDPFVFGRGGEEIAELAGAKIAFQVVPGITAAGGCAAYAGIPLTHRDYAQAVIFVTGHRAGQDSQQLSWPELARPGQTVVFFMARANLARICANLRAAGLPCDWPAALVVDATTARQRLVVGDLGNLPERAAAARADGAALLIVGQVVSLHETLGWFRPEQGGP